MADRLQKWLAAAGIGSRREIEGWIAAGRVKVNGKTATLGQKIGGSERVSVDGRIVHGISPRRQPRPRVLLYHKPVGEVCTRTDPEGRPTVFGALPKLAVGRWVIVGRLDIDTAGLLLFTTDGMLANALMHPSSELVREYAARVRGNPGSEVLQRLKQGIQLEDGPGRFEDIRIEGGSGSNRWYMVTVAEGRNRIIRRLWEAVDCQVSRLIRVRFGPVELPRHLRRGKSRELREGELLELYQATGLAVPAVLQSRHPPD